MVASPSHERARAPRAVAVASLALLAGLVVWLSGRPLDTADLWFHLKAGEAYATEGPWPAADPMLHTALPDAPVQHEWLFGVLVYGVKRVAGFHALRVLHVLAVLGTLALVFSLLRRESRSLPATCLATSLFLVLAWWRLVQLRPDLVSIAATFGIYRLLLEPDEPPSWRRVGAALALLVFWVNVHSLFAVGLALLLAGIAGLGSGAVLAGLAPDGAPLRSRYLARLRRVGSALGLGVVVTLLNPRGIEQHLTFLTSSRETAIWAIKDEWTPFDPLHFSQYGPWVSPLAWLVTDAVLAAFAAAVVLGALRLLRRRDVAALREADPVRLALGAAGAVALLVSVRFLWMAVFPMLFVLRACGALAARLPARGARLGSWALAAGCAALPVAFVGVGGFHSVESGVPLDPIAYLRTPWIAPNQYPAGVRFLHETRLEGNLFNGYLQGGFLGYWLAPRLRTFVDGRTEHYAPAVLDDYFAAVVRRGGRPGEDLLAMLDRRRVDIFFGVGLPLAKARDAPPGNGLYTTTNLEGAPGWVPIFRAVDEAIYLRTNERNRANLERVADWYAAQGIPFDRQRGVDPLAVARARPDWAVAWRLVPVDYAALLAARDAADPRVRFAALNRLGLTYALLGAYAEQVEIDEAATRLRPRALAPHRRLVFGWLRLGQPHEALRAARELRSLAPRDPRSLAFERIARDVTAAGARAVDPALVDTLPLLEPAEVERALGGRFAPVPLDRDDPAVASRSRSSSASSGRPASS